MPTRRNRIVAFVLLLALLGTAYALTLAPSLTWAHNGGDGGDLITAAYTLGLAHPPGYPTYVLIGKLFSLLPVGDVAYRLNWMSAAGALCAAGALYGTLIGAAHVRPVAAFAAALCLGCSALLWSQAVIAEVYAPALAFAALVWLLATRSGQRARLLAAFVFGLGLGMHLSLSLMLPALAWWLWKESKLAGADWLRLSAAMLFGAAIYLYLPLRAAQWPPVEWGAPVTVQRFVWLVSGQLYQGYVFGVPPGEWPGRMLAFAGLLANGFTPPGLVVAGVGLLSAQARPWRMPLLLIAIPFSLFALGYHTSDSVVYLLPAWFALAFTLGLGAEAWLTSLQFARVRWASLVVLLAVPAWLGWEGLSLQNLRDDHEAADYGAQVMAAVSPGAVLVASDERHVFALWYFRYVVARRTDVNVIATGLAGFDWYREQLAHAQPSLLLPDSVAAPGGLPAYLQTLAARRPVYLVDSDPELLQALKVRIEGPVWKVETTLP